MLAFCPVLLKDPPSPFECLPTSGMPERPVFVLCLCDQAYLEAAQRIGAGCRQS